MNIIITGASRGIGKAVAEKFASNGYDVILCAKNEEPLKSLADDLIQKYAGIKVHYRCCDVSVKKEVQDFAEWVLKITDSIDILVNNAGAFIRGQLFDEPDGVLEQLMETNVYSAYHLSRAFLPAMVARKSGHIFNICSIAALKAYPFGGSYSITKYALTGFSTNLRDEMKEYGIKVTSVFPGATFTDSWKASGLPRSRFMEADDIAEMMFTAARLSPQACVEEIVIRPQLGDL